MDILANETIANMPSYAEFLKEIMQKKKKWEAFTRVSLTKEPSAVPHNRLPVKMKDPWSFIVPCYFENILVEKCLCDLGSSDMLVKVGRFYFPADFLILDMKKDIRMPIILGRGLLGMRGALIDVLEGKLALRMGKNVQEFKIFETLKCSSYVKSCYHLDIINTVSNGVYIRESLFDPLEGIITLGEDEDMKAVNVLSMEQNLVFAPLQDFRKYTYCVVQKRNMAGEEET
ncbi:uncharacterized protein [Coffea arabica]|uniref:Uncharacterized protein n=1 Tax=Coffea arabica TaxID=13443 RepID=A0A6P6USY9_COFAR|nr:uncharacterized protein LOC113714132 [Coffea arabica]